MRIGSFFVTTIATLLLAPPMLACSIEGATDQQALHGEGSGAGGGSGRDAGASDACTFTQGYWKNHLGAWPVGSLTLGLRAYTKVELIAILKTPVEGNGLIQLAHQLIAAKLNVAAGASGVDIDAAIGAADALIGKLVVGKDALAMKVTSDLVEQLDAFNNGKIGPGHCDGDGGDPGGDDDCDHDDDGACDDGDDHDDCDHHEPVCGDGVKDAGEACDDGNVANGDGCSATCTIELPVCGNGKVEVGETCDDGNTNNGDGCSSVCVCEPCH